MTVNICGLPYTVVEKEDSFNQDLHFGDVDYLKCEIQINKDLTDIGKKETLCHEIVHAILLHIGRNDLSQDETLVQSLGNAIFQSFEIKGVSNAQEL